MGGAEAALNRFLIGVEDALHAIRRKRPWLAEQTGIPISTINGWFSEDRQPRIEIAVRIAQALDTTVEYLVTGERPTQEQHEPDLEEFLDLLGSLSREQRTELKGAMRQYASTHFASRDKDEERTPGGSRTA